MIKWSIGWGNGWKGQSWHRLVKRLWQVQHGSDKKLSKGIMVTARYFFLNGCVIRREQTDTNGSQKPQHSDMLKTILQKILEKRDSVEWAKVNVCDPLSWWHYPTCWVLPIFSSFFQISNMKWCKMLDRDISPSQFKVNSLINQKI